MSVGLIFNGWWAHSFFSLSFDWFFDWFHWYLFFLLLLLLFWCAILSLTRVCTIFFPCTFYLLIWHVVLMQNDKTGACECVCWLYFLKCKWFCVCVCVCVWMQKRAVYSGDWISTCFMGAYVWAGSEQLIPIDLNLRYLDTVCVSERANTLVWLVFLISFFFLQCGFLFPVCCQHNHWLLCVYFMIGSPVWTH